MMTTMKVGLGRTPSPRAGALSPSSYTSATGHNHNNTSSNNNNGMELEVTWNPRQVSSDLQTAAQLLSERGLKLAAKWAVEQWMGLPPLEEDGQTTSSPSTNEVPPTTSFLDPTTIASIYQTEQSPLVFYAKTLLDLGEYAHAAATLSVSPVFNSKSNVESMPSPLPNLTSFGIYLRAYALYMAGERRKEEDQLELQSTDSNPVVAALSVNRYLPQLTFELLDAYHTNQLDAFGLYVFGMVLSSSSGSKSTVSLPSNGPSASTVLMESILKFPYNWSAWLDLAHCCLDDRTVERHIEERLQPTLSGHFMYHFFCAHLQCEHQAYPEALGIYERWMDSQLLGGSPYLLSQYGVVQYHMRQFALAKQTFQELHSQMPYRLECMEVYSNILYVQEDSVALSQLAHNAIQIDKFRAETCCIVGNYYSVKQQRAKAIQYFQRALKMDRTFTSAWTLMGHEYVEWKQTANAIECYRRAVQSSPGDYRAWYGLGQTYEFLTMPLYALYYYKRAVQLRPYDARMWCALGTIFAQLHNLPDAIRAYERAVQQGDTEGVATQKLAALYKQDDPEKAAQCYLRHLELRYQVTHPNAFAAAASPSTLNLETLLQGLVVETAEAEAILYLAEYHKTNDEYPTAIIFCSRLLEYAGPEKEDAKALLRELRSRATFQQPKRRTTTRNFDPISGGGGGPFFG